MRLRIVLPKVKPEAIAVPTRCVYADCGGRKLHLRQARDAGPNGKPLAVVRNGLFEVRDKFGAFGPGTNQAHISPEDIP